MSVLYTNPMISGFSPDPSIVFVGDTFFLVTSSFHIFPGLPVYASKDLRTWTHIGNAINRPTQLSLANATTHDFILETGHTMVATAGLWAPTIRHHRDTFYIICTNCTKGGEAFDTRNFYISTQDIWADRWSEPTWFDFKGIDPSLFFDDDDRAYVQGAWELTRAEQPSCTIKQFEIDIETGKPLSEIKEIWPGFAKYDTEGPHIYKKDGYYYLVAAEGGTFEHHMLSISRSKNIWGPYESYENNPILTSDGKDEYIQNAGHGELFQDGDGAWWAAVLAVRDIAGGRCPIGRETFLVPVTWPTGGWPMIEQPGMKFERKQCGTSQSTVFNTSHRVDDVYIRNANLDDYCSSCDGKITLKASSADLTTQNGTTTFLGKRQRDTDCVASATLQLEPNSQGQILKAGLAVYKDEYRIVQIYYDYEKAKVCSNVLNKTKGPATSTETTIVPTATCLEFMIRATKNNYDLCYRLVKEEAWTAVSSIDTMEMTGRDFTGTLFGIFANGKADIQRDFVQFQDFVVAPLPTQQRA